MELKLLSESLLMELESIKTVSSNIITQSNLSITLCRSLLSRFKKEILKNGFKDESSEIEFFKTIKQIPLSNLIYFFELKSFEIHFPKGSDNSKKKYIQRKIKKLNGFFMSNMDFIQYVELNKTCLDSHYFTREFFNEFNITHSKYYYRDPEFSSSHDVLLAKLNSNNRLIEYFEKRLVNIGIVDSQKTAHNENQLNWTASKIDMTELGYSLKNIGAINNGNVTIKEVVEALEEVFNFNSGNPYQNYLEIRIRKKSRTKFLDKLSIGLTSKMEDDDA